MYKMARIYGINNEPISARAEKLRAENALFTLAAGAAWKAVAEATREAKRANFMVFV